MVFPASGASAIEARTCAGKEVSADAVTQLTYLTITSAYYQANKLAEVLWKLSSAFGRNPEAFQEPCHEFRDISN
jgi:hypothetical protein